jgi:O-antigen/teichoic acid export membrane protein
MGRFLAASNLIGTLRIHYLAAREIGRARAVLELGLVINLVGGLLATGLLVLAASLIAEHLVKQPGLTDAVVIYSFTAPFVAVQGAAGAAFRVLDRFGLLASITAAVPAMRLAGAGAVLAVGGGLHPVLVSLLAAEAAGRSTRRSFATSPRGDSPRWKLCFGVRARQLRSSSSRPRWR